MTVDSALEEPRVKLMNNKSQDGLRDMWGMCLGSTSCTHYLNEGFCISSNMT